MERIRVTARELCLDAGHHVEGGSDIVFRMTRTDTALAHADFERDGTEIEMSHARSGIEGIRLFKTTGSSFAAFARDGYTTLPELQDRPLTILMDAHWQYADVRDATGDGARYVAVDLMRRALEHTFHDFNSRSIQELVHEMAQRLLKGFRQLSVVEFSAENHTPDKVAEGKDGSRVFAEPRQTFGKIGLVLRR